MGRKKQEPTFIRSIRVNEDIKDFLEQLPNANLFVLQLLEETEDYKNKLNPDYENKISVAEGNLNNYAITNDKLLVYFNRGEILPEELDIIKIEIPYTEISDCVKFDTGKKTNRTKYN